jgi:hypothetical protein
MCKDIQAWTEFVQISELSQDTISKTEKQSTLTEEFIHFY